MRISDWSSDVCSSDLAGHFVDCITAIREFSPGTKIEILTPDFRGKGRMERALEILAANPPDVFNHNVETVPDLYRNVRPGADYQWSMTLLRTEEHTSELQSLMRISYAVFCLKKKKT